MPLDPTRVRQHLRNFDLRRLFIEELGWDHHVGSLDVMVDGHSYSLDTVAQKRGFVVYRCGGQIPDYSTRRKIERQVGKSVHEHLIIYTDSDNSFQIWQWVKREAGKPANAVSTPTTGINRVMRSFKSSRIWFLPLKRKKKSQSSKSQVVFVQPLTSSALPNVSTIGSSPSTRLFSNSSKAFPT